VAGQARRENTRRMSIYTAKEPALSAPTGNITAHAHAWRIERLPPGQPEALHVLLVFPEPGEYAVLLQAHHEEADAVSRWFLITVPDRGSARVEPG